MTSYERSKSAPFYRRLKRLFGREPARLPVVTKKFEEYERPNIQLGLQEWLQSRRSEHALFGIVGQDHFPVTLAKLGQRDFSSNFRSGPVEYADVSVADGQQVASVKTGLYLIADEDAPLAVLVHDAHMSTGGMVVEVMARSGSHAEESIRDLTRIIRYGRAFRGHVLSVERGCFGQWIVNFHRLPSIKRDDVILPAAVFSRIERHTIRFSQYAAQLRGAGRHLKRGILLYGSPGTGKTFTAMYLASQMEGRTVILVTGTGIGGIGTACSLARMLEPATLILEDVDLIGTERGRQTVGANAVLYELLNQMDGLADDSDLLFILTTNRPDILEPALASRPGRIDQAIEIPLPDADCREQLIRCYSTGLRLEISEVSEIVRRTEGASAAFIRELLRKAAVFAVDGASGSSTDVVVNREHLDEALAELLVAGGQITQSLLGAAGMSGTVKENEPE